VAEENFAPGLEYISGPQSVTPWGLERSASDAPATG
jgi:hypothetical protein